MCNYSKQAPWKLNPQLASNHDLLAGCVLSGAGSGFLTDRTRFLKPKRKAKTTFSPSNRENALTTKTKSANPYSQPKGQSTTPPKPDDPLCQATSVVRCSRLLGQTSNCSPWICLYSYTDCTKGNRTDSNCGSKSSLKGTRNRKHAVALSAIRPENITASTHAGIAGTP